ncbi:unnamed protein product [Microthlaspi erraticum]|uniref:Uncharacterized protein n=1 Tax=Microthlaspi erraticum TaxID=1685480 RepID=A0A6D2HVE4_9BRAS|nr:unnamed protein product [Microthlaspi erraticum]
MTPPPATTNASITPTYKTFDDLEGKFWEWNYSSSTRRGEDAMEKDMKDGNKTRGVVMESGVCNFCIIVLFWCCKE